MAELIVALDTNNKRTAIDIARTLATAGVVSWFKIGLELFTSAGPKILTDLKHCSSTNVHARRYFVDLKMFDIPNTVYGGVYSAVQAGAHMLTLHTLGGKAMLCKAVDAVKKSADKGQHKPLLLGVTVLTSMGQGDLPFYAGSVADIVVRLAYTAHKAGLDGVVCSAYEVAMIKATCGKDFVCVTPGIRPVDTEKHDQHRTMTPAEAVAAGADYLVVGRPITHAVDPVAAAHAILHDMQRILP